MSDRPAGGDADESEQTAGTDDAGADGTAAVSSTYKVLGELDESGTGVLGRNTAASGTPVGVEGAVPNAAGGYGLSTPDDLRVGGTAELSGLGGSLTGGRSVTNLVGEGLTITDGSLSAAPAQPDVDDGTTSVGNVGGLTFGNGLALTDDGDGTVTLTLDTRWRMGPKLVRGTAEDDFGYGVDVSTDASTIVVGAPGDDPSGTDSGSIRIYDYDGRYTFNDTYSPADGDEGDSDDRFGEAVATDEQGENIVVGAPGDEDPNGTDAGSAYAFSSLGYSWHVITEDQRRLLPSDGNSGDRFGEAVAMSDQGRTALVGAPKADTSDGNYAGSAYVFETSDDWTGQGEVVGETTRLSPSDADADDEFGKAVALSADATTAVVGAWRDEDPNGTDAGSAYVFDGSGGWGSVTNETAKLYASDGGSGDEFGRAAAVTPDGSTAVVGATGAVYVFERSGGWSGTTTEVTKLTASDGASGDFFGAAVGIDADGSTVVVGALADDGGRGAVYVFDGTGGWGSVSTETEKVVAGGSEGGDNVGFDVALAGDGTTAIAGAPDDDNPNGSFAGSAYLAYETL